MINTFSSYDNNYDVLFICFAGRASGGFEWNNLTKALKIKKLLLHDTKDHWYLFGMNGNNFQSGVNEVSSFLQQEIKKANIKKVITVGSSMGAYAALVYGCLLGVSNILAISPMTNLESRKDAMQDVEIKHVPGYKDTGLLMDMLPVIQGQHFTADLHCGDYQPDIEAAKSIKNKFTIHYGCKDHYCTSWLAKNNKLIKMLESSLSGADRI